MTPATANQGKGKYRLIAELGRGGMSHVFLAVVQGPGGFNKFQVVKRLRSDLAEDPEFLTMFMEEARLSARINHPNVVQTNEIGHDGQYYFIAMEYLDGQSFEALHRRAAQKGGLPVPLQLRIIAEALHGLQYAHDLADYEGNPLRVVHRDMSPHNVFVTYEGHVKVVDFGIAKAADGTIQTRTGVFKGKCAYMAPEQFLGEKVDRRADLFSVGAMLWHTATGKRLWRGLTDIQIYTRLSQGSIPEVRDFNPNVDPRLETITMRALAPNPDHRYASAAELQADIEAYLDALEVRVTARDVGKYASELFADSRAEIRKAIEKQLRATSSVIDPPTAEIPALASLLPSGVVDVSPPPRRWSAGGEQLPADSSGESLPPPPMQLPPITGSTPFAPNVSGTGQALPATTSVPPPEPARRSRGAIAAMLAIPVVLIAVVTLIVVTRGEEKRDPEKKAAANTTTASTTTPSTKTTATATVTAVATTGGDKVEKGKLVITATPASARIFVDDELVTGNPASVTVSLDGATHKIRAEAAGYATKTESVTYDRPSASLTLSLDKATTVLAGKPGKPPATPTPTATTTATASAAPPPDPLALPPVSKPKPPLDESDPWKK